MLVIPALTMRKIMSEYYFSNEFQNIKEKVDGVYVRKNGFLLTKNGVQTSKVDWKVGKGFIQNGQLTRSDGDNQGTKSIDFLFLPSNSEAESFKLESALREFCCNGSYTSTNSKEYNVSGNEHIYKEYQNIDDANLNSDGDMIDEVERFFKRCPSHLARTKRSLRPVQSEACSLFNNINSSSPNMVCAIGPGGGKTKVACNWIRNLRDRSLIAYGDIVLVICHEADSQLEYIEELFNDQDINVISSRRQRFDFTKILKDKINVCLFTTSWLIQESNKNIVKDLINKLSACVYDEAHRHFFGKNSTNEMEKLVELIMSNTPYTIWLSGTAKSLIANLKSRGWIDQIYSYTLLQILNDKSKVDPKIPDLEIRILKDIPSWSQYKDLGYGQSDAITTTKLVSKQNEIQLVNFWKNLLFEKGNIFEKDGRKHILVLHDLIEQNDLSYKVIEDLKAQFSNDTLKQFKATSHDGIDESEGFEELRNTIGKSVCSIVHTAGKWTEGVNNPHWDAIINLSSVSTYEFDQQSKGRLFRVLPNKEKVIVYDVKPDRVIKFYHSMYADLPAEQMNKWTWKKILDLIPVFIRDKELFDKVEINYELFESEMDEYINNLPKSIFGKSDINLDIDLSALKHIIAGKLSKEITLEISKGEGGKDFTKTKNNNDKSQKDDDSVKNIPIESILNFLTEVCSFVRLENKITSWEDLWNYPNPDVFQNATKVSLSAFKNLIDNGLVKQQKMEEVLESVILERS